MDPISAMRMSAAGRITPFNPPVLQQAAKITTNELQGLGQIQPAQPQAVEPGRSFSDYLGDMVKEVNGKQTAATDAVNGVLSGENVPLHQAVLAVEEASVSFQLMVEVRNKLMESYQELMRMQI